MFEHSANFLRKKRTFHLLLLACLSLSLALPRLEAQPVRLLMDANLHKVDVLIGGQPFTSFIYPEDMEKAVLFPVRTPGGKVLTRGFPLEPRPGERVDHPHHVGIWFNYGDVNGFDFWNNSYRVPEERKDRYGTIRHRTVENILSGDTGILDVTADWIGGDGSTLLKESTRFVFAQENEIWTITRTATLTALDQEVLFEDNKEGMFAIRVARALEHPTVSPIKVVGEDGKPLEEAVLENKGVNGVYLSSEGVQGPEVWGTRAQWMRLGGEMDGEQVNLVILDHPDNVGYPTYWHARPYGLFAANTLGQKALSKGENELHFKLAPGASVTFRYKVLVASRELSPKEIGKMARQFAKE